MHLHLHFQFHTYLTWSILMYHNFFSFFFLFSLFSNRNLELTTVEVDFLDKMDSSILSALNFTFTMCRSNDRDPSWIALRHFLFQNHRSAPTLYHRTDMITPKLSCIFFIWLEYFIVSYGICLVIFYSMWCAQTTFYLGLFSFSFILL